MDVGEADLDYALEFDKVTAARYSPSVLVNADIVTRLRDLSLERLRTSEKFSELNQKIEFYLDLKNRKKTPLDEKGFFALREKLDAEKEEEKQLDAQNGKKDAVFDRDFYSEEVLAITADYVKLLDRPKVAGVR